MKPENKMEFAQVVHATFDNYSRPPPKPETLKAWWRLFERFSIEQVRNACQEHMRLEPKFPPSSGQLLDLMDARSADRFLGADEAWANALTSQDERNTVVWDDAQASAFAICRVVLDRGDEVGARMAFKDAYQRLVAAARADGREPRSMVSLGWNQSTRVPTLRKALQQHTTLAPVAQMLLPSLIDEEAVDVVAAKGNLARIRAMLTCTEDSTQRAMREREARNRSERDTADAKKAAIAGRVRAYREAKGEKLGKQG